MRRLEHDDRHGLPVDVDDPHVYGAEALFAEPDARDLLAAFAGLSPPLRRATGYGIDGTTYGLEIGNCQQFTRVQWWGGNSPGDDALGAMFERAVGEFESVLPRSTLGSLR